MIGCVLAWWIIHGLEAAEVASVTREFFGCWVNSRAAEDKSPSGRPRGVTFPIREGELEEFVQAMQVCDLRQASRPGRCKALGQGRLDVFDLCRAKCSEWVRATPSSRPLGPSGAEGCSLREEGG